MICLVLACLLPGFIGASIFFVYEYKKSRTQLSKDTLQTARALVQSVDSQLLRAQAIAQALSTSDSLAKKDLARFHMSAQRAVALSGIGVNIVLKDKAGRQLLNTAVAYGTPLTTPPAPEQIRPVFETGKPTYSDIFIGPVLKRYRISVDVPVVINNKVVYALAINIYPEHFNTLLNNQGLPREPPVSD